MDRSYAERMAIFISSTLINEYNHQKGTEKLRFVTQEFIDHCSLKGEVLPKPEVVLKDYSGILVASTILKPVVDVTIDVQKVLLGTDTVVSGAILKREFNIIYSAIGVEWMGIRSENSDTWTGECSGMQLDKTPTPNSLFSSVINSDNDEIIKASTSSKSGIFHLCAGDYRKPKNIIKLNVDFNGIVLVN
mgnify:CR=1 FL=1